MTNQVPPALKVPDSKDLLKECDEMPALIHEKVGKKFEEQAKYFMAVENLFAQVSKQVKDLVALYETSPGTDEEKAAVIKMKVATEEKASAKAGEPRVVPMEELVGENSIAYAMKWVIETMRFIEIWKQ